MLISWAVNAEPILLLSRSSPHLGPQWRTRRGPPRPVSVTAHPVVTPTHPQSNLPMPPSKKKNEPSSELDLSPRNKIFCPCQGRWGAQKWIMGIAKVNMLFWVFRRIELFDCNIHLFLNCVCSAEVIRSLFYLNFLFQCIIYSLAKHFGQLWLFLNVLRKEIFCKFFSEWNSSIILLQGAFFKGKLTNAMQPPQVMLGHFNQEATCYCWRSNNAELVIWRIRRKLRKIFINWATVWRPHRSLRYNFWT